MVWPTGTPLDQTPVASFVPAVPLPRRFGDLALPDLGEGGIGTVVEADHTQAGCRVAVKMLSHKFTPDGPAVLWFQKEARLLGEVRHANIANLLDVGEAGGACFLVIELVAGIDLKGALRNGPLAELQALQIVRDVAAALPVLHQRGIVHRDLMPANILLSAEAQPGEAPADAVLNALAVGTPVIVKLTDFGLARHIDQLSSLELIRTGALLGTPYYIAPEQCTGKSGVLPTTDLHSLGVTLFEMLAGRLPFRDEDAVRLISQHCFTAPPDYLKFDRSPVKDLGNPTAIHTELVRTLHQHAVQLGIATVAEGVETAETLQACRELGFTHFQGYLFGQPSRLTATPSSSRA